MVVPEKKITSPEVHEAYLNSRNFALFWDFILQLNKASENRKRSDVVPGSVSPKLRHLVGVLGRVRSWVDEVELEPAKVGRFGNGAFRTWHKRMAEASLDDMGKVNEEHAEELAAYLSHSFGSEVRLDYGTGHEVSFAVLLYAMRECGAYEASGEEYAALALHVLPAYLSATRAAQRRFNLEPAGSRGVWGLDDFSFLPFVLGSAQLLDNSRVPPGFVSSEELIKEHRADFLYVDAVAAIKEVKKGAFHEHSTMLWDISGVRQGWPKINQGMLKMYKAEVFGKFPVMQHMLFGRLFPFPEMYRDAPPPEVRVVSGGPVSNVKVDDDDDDDDSDE